MAELVSAKTFQLTHNLFVNKNVTHIDSVRVFDVGQGDCIGIVEDGDVILYVDYGGLFNHPDKGSYQNIQKKMKVSDGTPIILTHWDWDHYYSAIQNPAAIEKARWLAPRQTIGPNGLKFANSLRNLRCWPESVKTKPITFPIGDIYRVQIEKCAALPKDISGKEDRNFTGLVVTIQLLNEDGEIEKFILLPGDVPFDRIRSLKKPQGECVGMLAYHHGAKSHWRQKTSLSRPRKTKASLKIVYSYGKGNSYSHPFRIKYRQWSAIQCHTPDLRDRGEKYVDIFLLPMEGS